MVYSLAGIAGLGFIVWGHHMFQSGMDPRLGTGFMIATIMIALPSAVKVFNWLGTTWRGNIQYTTAMLFALAFVSLFIIGGLSGIFMAATPGDIYIHDTYFIVAHLHYVLFASSLMGIFAGIYYWYPKMFGRMMNETLGKIHFFLSFVGAYCIFMPFHYLGIAGNVRRYQAFVDDYLQPLIPVHKFITVAALITGAAQLVFLYNLIHSRFWGRPAPENPWECTSLEWSTPSSPPPFDNFGGSLPEVHHDPYQYGVQGSKGDYVMQTSPENVPAGSD